jgi:hypothetical protein
MSYLAMPDVPMRRAGFTRIELAVLILMVACVFALIAPGLLRLHNLHARTQSVGFLKQLSLGLLNAEDIRGQFPPATGVYGNDQQLHTTLHIHLLPFIEQSNCYDAIRDGRLNAADVVIPVLLSPLDSSVESGPGVTNFAANLRVFSDLGLKTPEQRSISPAPEGNDPETGKPWFYGSASVRSITDGLSYTIALVTQYSICGTAKGRNLFSNSAGRKTNSPFFGYYAPLWPPLNDDGIENGRVGEVFQVAPAVDNCNPSYTPHTLTKESGMVVGVLDGGVRIVSTNVSPETWGRMVQPNDGKPIPPDW